MPELSPAALAVRDAAEKQTDLDFRFAPAIAAAALQAVADQWKTEIQGKPTSEFISGIRNCIDALNEIANELKAQ